MKEWLLTSTLPYWLMFLMTVITGGMCLAVRWVVVKNENSKLLSFGAVLALTILIISVIACEWAIYISIQNECLWWIEDKEIGFFTRLVRAIPLYLFLTVQIFQLKYYKDYIGAYLRTADLDVKGIIRGTVFLLAAVFILYMVLDWVGVEKPLRDYIFYGVLVAGIVICLGKSFYKNISAVGLIKGVGFTVISLIIVSGAVVSMILFFNVVLTLFFQTLIYVAFLLMFNNVISSMNLGIKHQEYEAKLFRRPPSHD